MMGSTYSRSLTVKPELEGFMLQPVDLYRIMSFKSRIKARGERKKLLPVEACFQPLSSTGQLLGGKKLL